LAAVAALLLAGVLSACSIGDTSAASAGQAAQAAVDERGTTTVVAQARVAAIGVYTHPGAPRPAISLPSPNRYGAPVVFLVRGHQDGWLEVMLPVKPNGSVGWIRRADVDLAANDYRMDIDLAAFTLTVWRGHDVVAREAIATGRPSTPTPAGVYYLTELLQPPDPDGDYGRYAFGISAFSDVVTEFAGGDGQVGIHGTPMAGDLGREVSHGCIRVSNGAIERLARLLPLGTPVLIA
jgi:lipoprotein-anchoring transpeptidase ErfK/SrfK